MSEDLRTHLLQPVREGGHGYGSELDEAVSKFRDLAQMHEEDHASEAGWAAAITHLHPENADD